MISQLTGYPSFSRSAGIKRAEIRHFNLLVVEQTVYIIVVMTNHSVIKNRLLHYPVGASDEQVQLINAILNSGLSVLRRERLRRN
jgi:heat-inducible transcriptional repressor